MVYFLSGAPREIHRRLQGASLELGETLYVSPHESVVARGADSMAA